MTRRFALFGIAVGLILSIACGLLGVSSWRTWRALPPEPRRGALAALIASASPNNWVEAAGQWLCDQSYADGRLRYVPLVDGEARVVVAFDKPFDCPPRAPVRGVLERTDRRGLVLWTYEGPDNARTGVILCAGFLALGALLTGFYALKLT